ncbi:HNH endonuclease [Clostridium perfringens]|uniref:HNH endonuclease n=1 Tax=Clostridium perfringens TaxID=1502 RepID=UPI002A32FA77|nr:HNH endonuclease [Clostridium perfringens]
MPKKVCNYSGCNNLINMNETYCSEHRVESNKERHKCYKVRRKDKDEQAFYNSKVWRIVRTSVLNRDNGLCKLCLKENRIRLADVVHHIIELKERRELGLEKSNLLSLCDSCHKKIHAKYKKGIVTKKNTQEELFKLISDG